MKSLLLLLALSATPIFLNAQCTVATNAVEMTNLVCQGGTSYRSGVAFNPNYNIYYSVNSGSSSYQIETFDINGTYLSTIAQGFDYRGLWWNPTLNQLDGNGYNSSGIRVHNLNATTGYPLGTGTTVIPGMIQPATHSCGQFDPVNNEIIYYNAGNIERYNRTTGAYIGANLITGLPVATTNLNTTSIGYTGCTGMEVAIYDYVLQRVYFINLSTGAYVTTSQLPANAPTQSNQRMSFSNNLFWLFDTSTLTWKSYGVIDACTETSNTISATTCNAYTSPSGNYTWTSTGIYADTIPNAAGCDSVITVDLTITPETYSSITANTCGSYTAPSGNVWTSTGVFADTIPNSMGCDSIIMIDLTVNTETYNTITETTCVSYTSPSGNLLTSTGIYTDTIANSAGCDSILTIDLTINAISDISTSTTGTTITANNASATYIWLDCNSNYAVIPNETAQTYSPTLNGSYAVQLTENGCIDTSACAEISTIGIIENEFRSSLMIYPNPTNGEFSVDLGSDFQSIQIAITDLTGRKVYSEKYMDNQLINLHLIEPAGVYLMTVVADEKKAVVRIVKK